MSNKFPLWVAAAAVVVVASSAFAQSAVRQVGVSVPSGDPLYPDRVKGANGQTYFCKSPISGAGGKLVRPCKRVNVNGVSEGLETMSPAIYGGLVASFVNALLPS